jgi:EmrB/QacA subfamily drug resistance transporter
MPEQLQRRSPRSSGEVTLAIASIATFVAFLDVTVVNVAFPDLRRAFPDASLSLLSWVIAAYGVVFAAALTPAGRIADAVGRKRIFLTGLALFTVASAGCAVAPTVGALVAVRAVQGLGAAMMIPAALGLLLAVTAPEKRAAAVGLWGASTSIAAVAGPSLGGLLVDATGWRAVFAINLPIGVAALAAGARRLPEVRGGDHRLPDLAGTLLLTAGFALPVVALTQAGEWGWGAARTLSLLAGGALLLAAALVRARSHPAPAVEVDLWRTRAFALANLGSVFAGVALYAWLLSGILFLTAIWGYSILEAGLAVSPGALASAVAAIVAGRVVDRRGPRAVVIPAGLLLAGAGLWLAAAAGAHAAFLTVWLPAGLLSGIALGSISVALTSAAARALPPARFAAGTGLNMTARQLGGALGIALIPPILAAHPGGAGYRDVFLLCAIASGLVAATGLLLVPAQRPAPASGAAAVAGAAK